MTQTTQAPSSARPPVPQSLVRARIHAPWLWRQQRLAAQNKRRTEAVALSSYFRLMYRYRSWIAVAAGAGLVVGLLAAGLQKPDWVSGATILAPAVAIDPQDPPDKVLRKKKSVTIDTEASILTSDLVLRRAVAGSSVTPNELFRRTTVTAAANSRVIKVQVQDADPARAEFLVTGLADAYLDARRQLLTDRRSQQVAAVEREIAALKAEQKRLEQTPGTSDSGAVESRLGKLNGQLGELQASEVVPGELLRSATEPRKVSRQPEIRILSWLLVCLLLGGLAIAWRERRPPAPRTSAAVNRVPMAGDLAVAVLDEQGSVDDGHGGWVRIADGIGPRPAATLIVSLDDGPASVAVTTLALALRRRGYTVSSMLGLDHETPATGGATAVMMKVRADGRHLVGDGPPLDDLEHSLSTTQADDVVLMFAPGAVSERELDAAIERVVRLGVPVMGIILDLAHQKHSRLDQLTARFSG